MTSTTACLLVNMYRRRCNQPGRCVTGHKVPQEGDCTIIFHGSFRGGSLRGGSTFLGNGASIRGGLVICEGVSCESVLCLPPWWGRSGSRGSTL